MRRHRRKRHKQKRLENFFEHLSPDMLIYLFFLAANAWKSYKINKGKESGIMEKVIPYTFDIAILVTFVFLIINIYKRNQDEERTRSRSGKIIALFCITLVITVFKILVFM